MSKQPRGLGKGLGALLGDQAISQIRKPVEYVHKTVVTSDTPEDEKAMADIMLIPAGFIEANRGVAEKVLFESTNRNGMMSGYTGNYIRIERPYDPDCIGRITDIII